MQFTFNTSLTCNIENHSIVDFVFHNFKDPTSVYQMVHDQEAGSSELAIYFNLSNEHKWNNNIIIVWW